MFGMGTGGSLRLLSPERSGAPALRCRLPLPAGSAIGRPPGFLERLALGFAPSKLHRLKSLFPRFRLSRPTKTLLTFLASIQLPQIIFFGLSFRSQVSASLCALPNPCSLIPNPSFQDQALDRLVSSSCTHYCASTDDLSTLSSSRGLTCF